MFDLQVNLSDRERLSTYCHWSQLCYWYAEYADEESLRWCIDAVKRVTDGLTSKSGLCSLSSSI